MEGLPPEDFTREKLLQALEPPILAYGRGSVLWPLRASLSGQKASPDPLAIAEVLGKDEVLRRVAAGGNKIGVAL